jgi:hypothetical protein
MIVGFLKHGTGGGNDNDELESKKIPALSLYPVTLIRFFSI